MTTGDAAVPDQREFVHRPGDAMAVEARLGVGERLSIELQPAGGYRFSAIESSDPVVARVVESFAEDEFVVHAVISGSRPGVATLRATTWFSGDRFGPPTRLWQMTVHVES